MRNADPLLTGLAAVIWGTIYLVTTEWLPQGYPLTTSLIRALPAGPLLLAWANDHRLLQPPRHHSALGVVTALSQPLINCRASSRSALRNSSRK